MLFRSYYASLNHLAKGECKADEVYKIELLMKQAKISTELRKVVSAALLRAETTSTPAAAIELADNRIVTAKTSELLGASAALILNAIKVLGNIDDSIHLISPTVIEPVQKLKTQYLGSSNPRLHTDEILIALSMCAATDNNAHLALEQLPKLRGCQVHTSVMLSNVDIKIFHKLGIQLTSEPRYEHKKI